MTFNYYYDPSIEQTHIEKHNVSDQEINEFFTNTIYLTHKREDDSYISIGKLNSNRYLQVIYRKVTREHYYIITAYDIEDNEIIIMLENYLDTQKIK